jgi:hypothetical protein
MTSAWTKEGDPAARGTPTDRFYQGVLGLSDSARELVGRRYERERLAGNDRIEDARRAARDELGAERFREIFEAAAERVEDQQQGPAWWAVGDAAIALACRKQLRPDQFRVLVTPLSVALPWLNTVGGGASEA